MDRTDATFESHAPVLGLGANPGPLLMILYGVPLAVALAPSCLLSSPFARLLSLVAAPTVATLGLILLAGGLARLALPAMRRGRFPRDAKHAVYGRRMLYGSCWTAIYYMKPLYHLVLVTPWLKRLVFRLFGYRGSLAFTLYPDTWIRDLALLDLGEDCYVSNRATLGTNIVLGQDSILVDGIQIGARSVVGHLAALAPGVRVGDDCCLGVRCSVGGRVTIGSRVRVGPLCAINHAARIEDDVKIEAGCYVGLRAEIGAGIALRTGTAVPDGAVLRSQVEADALPRSGYAMAVAQPGEPKLPTAA